MSALNAKHFKDENTARQYLERSGGQMRRLPALWFDLQGSLRPSGQGSSPGPLVKALKAHHVDDCPFVDLPQSKSSRWGGGATADEMREMQRVKPVLVAQIRFVEWTGQLRHAAFLGLRFGQERARGAAGTPCLTVSVRPGADIGARPTVASF